MGFQKVIFPISNSLKSAWNTADNSDLFEGDNLVLIVEPSEYVPEWGDRARPKRGISTWYAQKKATINPDRFTLNLKECREAVFRILQKLESDSNDNTTLITCLDYVFPDATDTGTGYSTRQGVLTVSVGSGMMSGEDGRYFLGVSAEFEIYRY